MNAKQEFLSVTEKQKVICAKVAISPHWDITTEFNLKPGYTEQEYQEFLTNLDFDYDDGYGTQHLYGIIWCDNGVWFDRHEYDGSESWESHKYPEIPTVWGPAKKIIDDSDSEEDYWDGDESDKCLQ